MHPRSGKLMFQIQHKIHPNTRNGNEKKRFETNVNQNENALPRTVDAADIVFTGALHTSSTNSFNWMTILKPTSRDQCSPSTCLKWKLNQHPINNRLSL